MTASEASAPQVLDPKVGDALLDEEEVVTIMQHPKVVGAITKLKEDPSAYNSLMAEDPELQELFNTLNTKMAAKEKAQAAAKAVPRKMTMDSPADAGADVPPLEDAVQVECENARAAGTVAFEAGDYVVACTHYARATELDPHHAPHWTNLSVARLRASDPTGAAAAAREATRRNPRFAKAWLRLGEALTELGEAAEAVEIFEAGLKRAEGAIRLSLTKGLQRAQELAPPKPKLFKSAKDVGAGGTRPGAPRGAEAAATDKTPSAAGEANAPPAEPADEKPPAKALPTWEEEKALAAETDALRQKTADQMKKYAEMAKQQTLRTAAAPPAPVAPAAAVDATAPKAPLAAGAGAVPPASVPMRRVLIAEEEEEVDGGAPPDAKAADGESADGESADGESADGESAVMGPALPPALPTAPAIVAAAGPDASSDGDGAAVEAAVDSQGADSGNPSSAAESALGAALAQWSLNKPQSPPASPSKRQAESEAAPTPKQTGTAPKPPALALSNDLIFDLA